MSKIEGVTIMLLRPTEVSERSKFAKALEALQPWMAAMSLEDEMTLLECIEKHPDLPPHLMDEARDQRDEVLATAGRRLMWGKSAEAVNEDEEGLAAVQAAGGDET